MRCLSVPLAHAMRYHSGCLHQHPCHARVKPVSQPSLTGVHLKGSESSTKKVEGKPYSPLEGSCEPTRTRLVTYAHPGIPGRPKAETEYSRSQLLNFYR